METPLIYTIDAANRRVLVIYVTQPDLLEWAHVIEQIFQDPAYEPGFDFVLDRRTLPTPPGEACLQGFTRFVELVTAETQEARWAMVQAYEGQFELLGVAAHGLEKRMRNFASMEDALHWLDQRDA